MESVNFFIPKTNEKPQDFLRLFALSVKISEILFFYITLF